MLSVTTSKSLSHPLVISVTRAGRLYCGVGKQARTLRQWVQHITLLWSAIITSTASTVWLISDFNEEKDGGWNFPSRKQVLSFCAIASDLTVINIPHFSLSHLWLSFTVGIFQMNSVRSQ